MARRVRTHVNPLSITKEYSFEGFENKNPIIVDVGACKGEFTASLLEQFPEKNFLAFEIRTPLAKRLEKKFIDFKNVRVFDGDAGRNFRRVMEPQILAGVEVETVYINFPDPWFKDRHKKRRFVNEYFLHECVEYFSSQTKFVFQTDQKMLFDETLDVIRKTRNWNTEFFNESPFGIRTDWELAKMREGCEIWRIRFWKKSSD